MKPRNMEKKEIFSGKKARQYSDKLAQNLEKSSNYAFVLPDPKHISKYAIGKTLLKIYDKWVIHLPQIFSKIAQLYQKFAAKPTMR